VIPDKDIRAAQSVPIFSHSIIRIMYNVLPLTKYIKSFACIASFIDNFREYVDLASSLEASPSARKNKDHIALARRLEGVKQSQDLCVRRIWPVYAHVASAQVHRDDER
jgi:hypothetical protein